MPDVVNYVIDRSMALFRLIMPLSMRCRRPSERVFEYHNDGGSHGL